MMTNKSFGNRRTKRKKSTKYKTTSRRKVQYGSAYPFVNIERMTQKMLNGIEEVYHDKTEEINKLKEQITTMKKEAERELEQVKQNTEERIAYEKKRASDAEEQAISSRMRLDEAERKMKQYIEKKRVEDKELDEWYSNVKKTVEQKNDEINKLRKNAHRHRTSRGKRH